VHRICAELVRVFCLGALLGLTLSGLSAVAMTYINEEMHTESVGLGMELYISGSAVGGMSGRLIAGVLANYWGWRVGIGAIGVTGLCASVIVLRLLPASRHFVPRALSWQRSLGHVSKIFKDPGLPWLFAEGFFLMGMFVTVYNYLGYRLMAAPYDFVALTCGFFGGHSIASSWVGRRTHSPRRGPRHSICFYYIGSAIVGANGGLLYRAWGRNGVAVLVGIMALSGLTIAWKLRGLVPLEAANWVRLRPGGFQQPYQLPD